MKCKDFLGELTNYLDGAIDERTKAELEDIWPGATTAMWSVIPPRRPSRYTATRSFIPFPKTFAPGFVLPLSPSAKLARRVARSTSEPETAA